jgi:hypothetical protein
MMTISTITQMNQKASSNETPRIDEEEAAKVFRAMTMV